MGLGAADRTSMGAAGISLIVLQPYMLSSLIDECLTRLQGDRFNPIETEELPD